MNSKQMESAGKLSKASQWDDEQLERQIEALELVIPYLEGRGDCGIVVSQLRLSLEMLRSFKEFREERRRS
jgi:hypothetical protein